MIFHLKNNYSNHNREQARVDNIPQEDGCFISFEEMSNRLKYENTTLKIKHCSEDSFQKHL